LIPVENSPSGTSRLRIPPLVVALIRLGSFFSCQKLEIYHPFPTGFFIFKMYSQQSHNGSPIRTCSAGTARAGHNLMDISAMLNSSDEASTTDSDHFQSKVETHQHLIDSPTSDWTKQHLQLPSFTRGPVHSSDPRGPVHISPGSMIDYHQEPPSLLNGVHNRSPESMRALGAPNAPRVYTPYSSQRVIKSKPHHNTPPPPNVHLTRSNHRHSNKPYTREQVHFIRYQREDCNKISWPNILILFLKQFPEYKNLELPLNIAGLSSRYYRDCKVPKLNEQGELALDRKNNVIMIPCGVRGRDTKGKKTPYFLIDKHPDIALSYNWVKLEDKARARQILQDLEEEAEEKVISGIFLLRSWTMNSADD
jgi:hypothetical protein